MKKHKNIFYLFMLSMLVIVGCEDEESNYVTSNSHYLAADADLNLVYDNFSTYPVSGNIEVPAPTFNDIPVLYSFGVSSVTGTGTELIDRVQIDAVTGQITLNNNQNSFSTGAYSISVSVSTVDGVSVVSDALSISVLDVPADLSVTYSDTNEVSFVSEGVIATVNYADLSPSGSEITSATYALLDAPAGFSINANTGEVSKTTAALSGNHPISVTVNTNLGTRSFQNLFSVTVLDPPTLSYNQSTGTDALSKVTVSPWTTYTSAAPSLEGMNADGGYALIVPAEIPAGAIEITTGGVISLPDGHAYIPVGDYQIGVKVTNSGGTSVSFNDLFELSVEERWDANAIPDPDLKTGAWPTGWSTKKGLVRTDSHWSWVPKPFGIQFQHGNNHNYDEYFLSDFDITGLSGQVRVSFNKGAPGGAIGSYPTLYYSDSNADYAAAVNDTPGTLNLSDNWTTLLDNSAPDWAGAGASESEMIIDLSTFTGNNLYLLWQISSDTKATGYGKIVIDELSLEVSDVFTAEEE